MSSALSALSGTSAAPTRGARILLIDDEPGILDFVSRGLQAEGYVVATAVDAGSGLRAALSQAYDLIILDLLLPDRGGVDVLRDIVAKLPGQPVPRRK